MDTRLATLEHLYRSAGPMVLQYLRRRMSDATRAEELLQETFVVAAKDYEALAAVRSHEAWLIGIARNLLRAHHRHIRLRRATALEHEPPAPDNTQDDPRLSDLKEAIERLPESHREVLQLRLAEELSYAEIAEALNIPIGTVRSRIHHAVATLRNQLAATADEATQWRNNP